MSFYRCNLVNGKCSNCGQLNTTQFPDELIRMQCIAGPCIYLGKPTKSIQVSCMSCQSTLTQLEKETYVCLIGEKPRCIPDYIPNNIHEWNEKPESQLYQLCRICLKFSAS